MVSNSEISNWLGRRGDTVEQLISFNVPHFEVLLADSKNLFGVPLRELHVRYRGTVSFRLRDAREVFQVPILDSSICRAVRQSLVLRIEFKSSDLLTWQIKALN